MTRSRQRLADFETRSVQIIAACTLGLAGMSALQAAPIQRSSGATRPPLSTQAATAQASPRMLDQRSASSNARRTVKNRMD